MTPLQRIQRAHVQIMRSEKFAFMSGILACGKVTVEDSCPTAYTDGWNVVYGSEFVAGLSEKEIAFLVLHENAHKMMRQLTMWKHLFKEDQTRANKATDYVVNQMIYDIDPQETVCKVLEEALLDDAYRGKSTKEVYDLLANEAGSGKGKGKNKGKGGTPIDEHGWGHEAETPEERSMREKQLDVAIRQGATLAGRLGGGVPRGVQDLMTPKVNWREVLRDFVSSVTSGRDVTTWRRPNRRYLHQGVYMPSMYAESVGDIVVTIDTSGSIGAVELSAFVSELASICETVTPNKLTLLWWDTEVRGVQEFEGDYSGMVSALIPAGGGGTSFDCVGDYIREKNLTPECVITLTDGLISDWGTPVSCPMMFAITTTITAPYGVTVRVEE